MYIWELTTSNQKSKLPAARLSPDFRPHEREQTRAHNSRPKEEQPLDEAAPGDPSKLATLPPPAPVWWGPFVPLCNFSMGKKKLRHLSLQSEEWLPCAS
jgi:hypothetical protein